MSKNVRKTVFVRREVDTGLRDYMVGIYGMMASGLFLTGAIAATIVSFNVTALLSMGAMLFAAIGTVVLAVTLSKGLVRFSVGTAQTLFFAYASLMGVVAAGSCQFFTGDSIIRVAFISGATFAAASFYGHVTKRDLTSWGSFLMMGLIGIMIACVVNIFMQSSALQFAISVLGVLLFTGLTAYDTQAMRTLYQQLPKDEILKSKMMIFGAFQLYLDVINLFFMFLQLFGDRK